MSQSKLTAKQEHFARLVAAGARHSDAYRQAYECGYGGPDRVGQGLTDSSIR